MKKKELSTKEEFQSDVLDLTRKILSGVQLKEIDWADSLKGQARIDFLKYCSIVASHPVFEQIFSMLFYPHIEEAAIRAENYDIVSFHRATANGVSLVREFFVKYSKTYTEEFEKDPEKFDPQKAFEPVADE